MNFYHKPVLFKEVMHWLNPQKNSIYVDGTLGGGGHSLGFLQLLETSGKVIGIDRDPQAISHAQLRFKDYTNFIPILGNFHNIIEILSENKISKTDGILLDLGVSSHQLDTPERGFSYHLDAPIDMRMSQKDKITARDILNSYSQQELSEIFKNYGEEKWARRIASILVKRRVLNPINTTKDLVDVIDASIPSAVRKKTNKHPARKVFQAIRIAVNNELDPLNDAIKDCVNCLKIGARLCVITFHSLEDRIVKRSFKELEKSCTCPPKIPICICDKVSYGKVLGGGAIKVSDEEATLNPRSRSAILRVFERR